MFNTISKTLIVITLISTLHFPNAQAMDAMQAAPNQENSVIVIPIWNTGDRAPYEFLMSKDALCYSNNQLVALSVAAGELRDTLLKINDSKLPSHLCLILGDRELVMKLQGINFIPGVNMRDVFQLAPSQPEFIQAYQACLAAQHKQNSSQVERRTIKAGSSWNQPPADACINPTHSDPDGAGSDSTDTNDGAQSAKQEEEDAKTLPQNPVVLLKISNNNSILYTTVGIVALGAILFHKQLINAYEQYVSPPKQSSKQKRQGLNARYYSPIVNQALQAQSDITKINSQESTAIPEIGYLNQTDIGATNSTIQISNSTLQETNSQNLIQNIGGIKEMPSQLDTHRDLSISNSPAEMNTTVIIDSSSDIDQDTQNDTHSAINTLQKMKV